MTDDKITVSLQLTKDLYNYVKRKAYLEGTTVSYIIRKLVIDASRLEEKDSGK